jgi:hypothetical protein
MSDTSAGGRRVLSLAMAGLLACGLVVAVLASTGVVGGSGTEAVTGVIGSEKTVFLTDQRVADRLAELGLTIDHREAGSRQIATGFDLTREDFSFPSGAAATAKILQEHDTTGSVDVFFSPMVIATWQPVADILVANGFAEDEGGWYSFDLEAYLAALEQGQRWSELTGSGPYDVNKHVLITSTDVRRSNSAAMYLALLSYVVNDNTVVASSTAATTAAAEVAPAFLLQGFSESSSAQPFENYLVRGMGAVPMVMIYEAQFMAEVFSQSPSITSEMVLLYPSPTIYSQHTVVAHSELGLEMAEALDTDPELNRLAAEHGFRGADDVRFGELMAESGIQAPASVANVINPPAYEFLEQMISEIEEAYQ